MNNTRTFTSDNVVQHVDDTLRDRDKGWIIIHVDDSIKISNFTLQLKTRFDDHVNAIPCDLYEPIIYNLHQQFAFERTTAAPGMLVSKTTCLYEQGKQPVCKHTDPSKSILMSATDVALSTSSVSASLHGSCKIQFQDNSYNHNKKNFVLQVAIYDASASDFGKPLLVLQSSAFKVFARKKQDKKRKRNDAVEVQQQSIFTASFARQGQCDGLSSALQQHENDYSLERPNKVLLLSSEKKNNKADVARIDTVTAKPLVEQQEQHSPVVVLMDNAVGQSKFDEVEDFTKKLSHFLSTLDANKRCKLMENAVSAFIEVDPKSSCRLLFDHLQKKLIQ